MRSNDTRTVRKHLHRRRIRKPTVCLINDGEFAFGRHLDETDLPLPVFTTGGVHEVAVDSASTRLARPQRMKTHGCRVTQSGEKGESILSRSFTVFARSSNSAETMKGTLIMPSTRRCWSGGTMLIVLDSSVAVIVERLKARKNGSMIQT